MPGTSSTMDSPSRQLLAEQLERLRLIDRDFLNQLDRDDEQAREQYLRELEAAKAHHETVRKRAELESQKWRLEQERIKRKEFEEAEAKLRAQRAEEAAERERVQKEQEEHERRKRQDAERREREKAERKAREEAEIKARQDAAHRAKEEAERKAREDAARKAQENAEKEKAARESEEAARKSQQAVAATPAAPPVSATTPSSQPSTATKNALVLPNTSKEEVHKQYLLLHRRLKEFRGDIKKLGVADPKFKTQLFEARMEIKKRVGQIRGVQLGYKEPIGHIHKALTSALSQTAYGYDVRRLVIDSSPIAQQPAPVQMSALFLYMLHIFSKCLIQQFIRESSSNHKMADNIGIGAISIFSDPSLMCGEFALVDMLLAKFHSLCPILFGIYGDERTVQGRARLGWRNHDDKQAFNNIVSGLSSGYAALTLRDLTKLRVPRQNPFPNTWYWQCMARIVNTPVKEVTETHLIALKSLIESNVDKFIKLYGQMAKIAIRNATGVFPRTVDKQFPIAAGGLRVLQEILEREFHLTV